MIWGRATIFKMGLKKYIVSSSKSAKSGINSVTLTSAEPSTGDKKVKISHYNLF